MGGLLILETFMMQRTLDLKNGPENPIFRDRFTADPATFINGDTLYIVCGEDVLPPDAPPKEYFRMPHWLLYSTQDMKSFKYEGIMCKSHDFPFAAPNTAWASQAIKGPDGKYYFYVTVGLGEKGYPHVVGVAVAENPVGPYIPCDQPLVTPAMVKEDTGYTREDDIDPTVFIDDDGSAYLSWGQLKPRVAKLKENMIEIERPIKMLFHEGWKSEDRFEEGPWFYKRGKWYYMFYASMRLDGDTPIAETLSYAMAESIHGPWTDGAVFTDCAPGVNGIGNSYTIHPAVVDWQGQTYLFYHNAALTLNVNGEEWQGATGRRSLCVNYLYFDDSGKPQFVDVRTFTGISVPPIGDS
jgi:beta-xylosidase